MAASNFESKMREKRAKEAKIEFLQKEHKRDQLCLFTNHWQLHAGDARRRIDESIIADEKRIDEENYRNAARARRTKANRDQDQKIASAMQMRKARELSEAARVQLIVDSSQELRELQSQLQAAYMNKEIAQQLQDKAVKEHREAMATALMDEEMNRAWHEKGRELAQKAAAQRGKAGAIRTALNDQMEANARRKHEEGQAEYARDRAQVDAVLQAVMEEEAAAAAAKAAQQAATRKEIADWNVERVRLLEEKKAKQRADEEKIMNYQKRMDARDAGKLAAMEAKRQREEAIYAEILRKQAAKDKKRLELEALRETLMEEEEKAKLFKKEQDEKNARKKMIDDMKAQNKIIIETRRKNFAAIQAEEARQDQRMIEKFLEDDQKERAKIAKRLAADKAHMEAIRNEQARRQQLYVEAKERELEDLKVERENREFERKVVEAARRRLLQQHAQTLVDFLPKGIVRNKDDLDIIRNAAGRR